MFFSWKLCHEKKHEKCLKKTLDLSGGLAGLFQRFRKGVGGRELATNNPPKKGKKVLQKCVPLLLRGHRKKGYRKEASISGTGRVSSQQPPLSANPFSKLLIVPSRKGHFQISPCAPPPLAILQDRRNPCKSSTSIVTQIAATSNRKSLATAIAKNHCDSENTSKIAISLGFLQEIGIAIAWVTKFDKKFSEKCFFPKKFVVEGFLPVVSVRQHPALPSCRL